MYGLAAGGSLFAYSNYKIDGASCANKEFRNYISDRFSDAADGVSGIMESVSGFGSEALGAANAQWTAMGEAWNSLEAPAFFKSFFSGGDGGDGANGENASGNSSNGGGGDGNGAAAAAAAGAAAAVATDDGAQEGEEQQQSSTDATELMGLTRRLIHIRNLLKVIDQDDDSLILPSIVVIGSQSSGKSSVLEAIVGHEFLPKGNNMVTRRPIELTLIHTDPEDMPADGIVEYGEFPGLGVGRVTDFSRIQKMLYDLNMAVPAEQCVSAEPIELHIHSPHVPDLSLIDLPGYVQLSSMDQPEELREKISDLCDKYIREPNIILAVSAADVDLANSPALRASRRVDPLGSRTIGVVTKMDLVAPDVGAAILNNNKYPLSLGYVGVVCRPPGSGGILSRLSAVQRAAEYEREFFGTHADAFAAPTRGRNAGVQPLVGTGKLRERLMVVLEEHMGASLADVTGVVRSELDDAAYQFKVQYNDRLITPESYVAESIDVLKQRFNAFAHQFGKPEVRQLLKGSLDDKIMDILAQAYWSDGCVPEMCKLGDSRTPAEDFDPVWLQRADAAAGALTKSGIGRSATQLVTDTVRAQLEQIVLAEPFNHHQETAERIVAYGTALLRERYSLTADQVENCIKPFKYDIEIDGREWEGGRTRAISLVQQELSMCTEALDRLRRLIGSRRLRGAVEYVSQVEQRERDRVFAGTESEEAELARPGFSAALISKAREARFLEERANVLRMRIAALKSRRCRRGPDERAMCPEAFLNAVADKLAYNAVMFINIELLAEFFYQFPREIDARLAHGLEHDDVVRFARENPTICRHLDVQQRKVQLEDVMKHLDELSRVYGDRQPRRSSRWIFF
ncbi:mitochondrial dynamin GTPase Msp1 [Malassezia cuniculi]|uniref:dynamin GTPase n=1 Tax=Malassezia cuniculi TaxID=948313 RepID=A0AAF0EVL9_9BASI|nr:mitochondrial dynamin GTPase Msp1 [Malassezia cuniculi]